VAPFAERAPDFAIRAVAAERGTQRKPKRTQRSRKELETPNRRRGRGGGGGCCHDDVHVAAVTMPSSLHHTRPTLNTASSVALVGYTVCIRTKSLLPGTPHRLAALFSTKEARAPSRSPKSEADASNARRGPVHRKVYRVPIAFEQKERDYLLYGAASAGVLLVRAHLLGAYFF
jgi:hypothetical protein